jgi:hypothetical protein
MKAFELTLLGHIFTLSGGALKQVADCNLQFLASILFIFGFYLAKK